VESTPRDVLEQPFYPSFWTLTSALCTPVSPCPPKTPRDRAATHRRHTSSAAASNRLPNTSATAAVKGGARGGTLLQMRGVCKRGGAPRLDVRTCAPRGHPVVSIAAAQSSALAGGKRANTVKRENLLGGGRPRSPSNTLRERGVHLTLRPPPAAAGQAREERPLR